MGLRPPGIPSQFLSLCAILVNPRMHQPDFIKYIPRGICPALCKNSPQRNLSKFMFIAIGIRTPLSSPGCLKKSYWSKNSILFYSSISSWLGLIYAFISYPPISAESKESLSDPSLKLRQRGSDSSFRGWRSVYAIVHSILITFVFSTATQLALRFLVLFGSL